MKPARGRSLALAALVATLATWLPLDAALGQEAAADPPLDLSADNVSGTRGPEGDIVLLNGNVHITRGKTVITSESGRYLRSKGMLYLDRRVKVVDSTTTVSCEHAAYSEDADVIELTGRVRIKDGDVTLQAPSGTYDRRHGRAILFGGVTGSDSTQRLTCDRVTYYRERRRLEARGHVVGENVSHHTTLSADSVDYDRTDHEAVARGNPVLRSKDKDGRIAELRAMLLRVNTERKIAEAIDSVRFSRDTLQARGNYGWFDDEADHGWLTGKPMAWDNETRVSGDTLEIWTEDRALRRFVVHPNAVLDYSGMRPEVRGETNRLSGQRVEVFFSKDVMDSLIAVGSATNDYQAVPRAGKTAEANRSEGDTITVYFEDRKIERAVVVGQASGVYHFEVAQGDTVAAQNEVVRYDAPRIVFEIPQDRIVLDHKSHLTYRELELHARRVELDSEKQTLVATGEPKLVDRGDEVTGHLMTYDLESRTGNIYQASTAYEKGLYHGERIRKVGENELQVLHGSYSTCDQDPPHYRFSSTKMKIYLKDRLVAKPVVFYLANVPMFALPFYIFPIKPGRHSGLLLPQMEFGFNNQGGQFIRNAGYYWAPNDYFDLTVAGDYYQADPSWVLRGDFNYNVLYKMSGRVSGSYAQSELDDDVRWDLNGDHAQQLGDKTRLSAQAAFVSSRDYRRDLLFGTTLSQSLDQFLTSSLALSHNASWATFNVVFDRREDLNAEESLNGSPPGQTASLPSLTQSLPTVSLAFPTRTLGGLGFIKNSALGKSLSTVYFSLNSRYQAFHQNTAFLDQDSVLQAKEVHRGGMATNAAISDSRRLGGWLNFSPAFNTNFVIFDHDKLGNDFVPTGTWSTSLTTSTTFYGTFRTRMGPLVGLRHVIFPSVSVSYSPEFEGLTYVDANGVKQSRFENFGTINISGFKNARATFALDQRLQAKLRHGDQIERLDNLLSWNMVGSYNFLWKEQRQTHPLSNIASSMLLQPPGRFSANLSWATDVYSERPVRSLGYNLSLDLSGSRNEPVAELPLDAGRKPGDDVDFTEPWSVSLAYSYSGGYVSGPEWSSSKTLNGVAHYALTRSWMIDYGASYDPTIHRVMSQRFGLTRDLHCWQASFTRNFTLDAEAEYYFRIGIKDQREVYMEQGSRMNSYGGIR